MVDTATAVHTPLLALETGQIWGYIISPVGVGDEDLHVGVALHDAHWVLHSHLAQRSHRAELQGRLDRRQKQLTKANQPRIVQTHGQEHGSLPSETEGTAKIKGSKLWLRSSSAEAFRRIPSQSFDECRRRVPASQQAL